MELLIAGKIMIKQIDEEDVVYLASNYYVELNSARLLTDLQLRYDMEQDELEREIQKIEKEEKLTEEIPGNLCRSRGFLRVICPLLS